jgi:cytoskeletal protein CcmA (bactofilin family)
MAMLNLKRRLRDSGSGTPTFVSPSARIAGTIAGKGTFVCCGTVEGDSDIDGSLTLAHGGQWKGTIRATDIVVGGTVEGDVIALHQIEIAASARVTGSLTGKSIAVAEGAIINGDINVTSGAAPIKFQEKRQT